MRSSPATAGAPASEVTGLSTVVADSLAVLLARVGVVALGLVFVVVATRLLGPSDYGVFALILLTANLLMTASAQWLATAALRFGRESVEERGTMAPVTWSRVVIGGPLFVAGLLLVLVLHLLHGLPDELSLGAVALVAGLGFGLVLQEHQITALQAAGWMKLSAVALVGQQVLALVAIGALAAAGEDFTPELVAGALALATIGLGVALLPVLWRVAVVPAGVDPVLVRRVLRFSLPLIAFTVSQFVTRWVDLVVIGFFASTALVGVYAVAFQAYTALQTVVGAIVPVLTPLFVSMRAQRHEHLVGSYFETAVPQLAFLGSLACALVVPVCEPVVSLVFGSRFADAGQPLALLLPGLGLIAFASLLAPVLTLHERTRAVGAINAAAAAVNVAGDLILIGGLGFDLTGAAVASSIAAAVIAVGYLRVTRDCLGSRGRFPAEVFAPPLIAAVLVTAIPGLGGALAALGGTLVAAALVVWGVRPFKPADSELLLAIDPSSRMPRLALRVLSGLAR
jgi:O-antigen/teichoic acid export membrane protein